MMDGGVWCERLQSSPRNFGRIARHDRHAAVGCAQIDTDDDSSMIYSSFQMF
jgi:hypothetical protein